MGGLLGSTSVPDIKTVDLNQGPLPYQLLPEASPTCAELRVLVAEVRQRAARRRVVGGQIGGRARATSRAGLGVPESGPVFVGAEFAGRR
jgi:hypothetical protein